MTVRAIRNTLTTITSAATRVGPTLTVNVVMAALGLATGILIARVLGPSARGDAAAAVQWGTVAATIADFGIGLAMAYFVGSAPQRTRALWGLGLLLAATWGVVVALACGLLLPTYVQPGARDALRLAFLGMPAALLAGYQGYVLLGAQRVGAYNVSRLAGAIAYTVAVVTAVVAVRTAEMVAIALVASHVVSAGTSAALLLRRERPVWRIERGMLREVAVFGAKTQAASIAANATLRLDQLLLSLLATSLELGQYAVAVAIAGAPGPLYSAFAALVIPAVSREAKKGRGSRELLRHTRWAFIAGVPIITVGLLVMKPAVTVAFGDAYSPAVLPARILLVAAVFQGVNAILGNGLRTLGNPTAAAIGEGVGLIATVALLAMLLRPYGIVGAAVASLVAYAIVTVVLGLYARRATQDRLAPSNGRERAAL